MSLNGKYGDKKYFISFLPHSQHQLKLLVTAEFILRFLVSSTIFTFAMVWTFVFSQNSYVEILMLNSIRRWGFWEVLRSWVYLCEWDWCSKKGDPTEILCCFCHESTQVKGTNFESGGVPSQEHNYTGSLILDFPVFRTVRNKSLLFTSHLVYCFIIMVEGTKTICYTVGLKFTTLFHMTEYYLLSCYSDACNLHF